MKAKAGRTVRTSLLTALALSISALGCSGRQAPANKPKPPPPEAEDYCVRYGTSAHGRASDMFADFCKTQGSDPKLEQRMSAMLVRGGVNANRFSIRCRAGICSVKCVTVPRQKCVDDLHNAGKWSAGDALYGIGFQDELGQALFKFVTYDAVAALHARQDVVTRIASRLHGSPAFHACKQHANAHGRLLLYIEVPKLGPPTVTASGDISQTADADCVTKALMGAVVGERVTAPLSTRDLPIAVNL